MSTKRDVGLYRSLIGKIVSHVVFDSDCDEGLALSFTDGSSLAIGFSGEEGRIMYVPCDTNPVQGSAEHDTGKTRPSLVILSMSRALQSVSKVATFGAEKYTDDGWRRYTDAMLRHQLAEAGGEANDPESGLPHAAHIAWNALARLDLMLRAEGAQRRAPMTIEEALAKLPGKDMMLRPTPVPDGTYDNRTTRMREEWRNGEKVDSISESRLEKHHIIYPGLVVDPFGTYPDLPRE